MKLTLGENLRRLRKEQDLTQEQLADKLGVTYQSVSRWENGSTYPDLELIPAIAEIFSVTIDALLGIPEAEKEKKAEAAYDDLRRECMKQDYDADKIIGAIRDIRRNYMHSSKSWKPWVDGNNRAFRDPKILPEVRLLAEAYLARHPLDMNVLQTLAVVEDEEHIEKFLKKNAPAFDCSERALRRMRYRALGNKEKYEPERMMFIYHSIADLMGEQNLINIWERTPEKTDAARDFIKSFLSLIRTGGSDTEPDIWTGDVLCSYIDAAEKYMRTGDPAEALEMLTKHVELLENTMKITEPIKLSTSCPWLEGMEWTAEESWHTTDNGPDSPEERMIFIASKIEDSSVCCCIYPNESLRYLNRPIFESLRENPQFTALCDRVKALVVTRPQKKA